MKYWRFECNIAYELRSKGLEIIHIRPDNIVKLRSRNTWFSKSCHQWCEHRSSEKWRLNSRKPSVWSGITNWNVWLHFKEDFEQCLVRNQKGSIPPASGNEADCIVKGKVGVNDQPNDQPLMKEFRAAFVRSPRQKKNTRRAARQLKCIKCWKLVTDNHCQSVATADTELREKFVTALRLRNSWRQKLRSVMKSLPTCPGKLLT